MLIALALTSTAAFAGEIDDAEDVGLARVVARESGWHPATRGLIYTRLRLAPATCLKGACATLTSATVWGGHVGDLEQRVAHQPVPAVGQLVLLARRGDAIVVVVKPERELLALSGQPTPTPPLPTRNHP